jgi:hypothetical protein
MTLGRTASNAIKIKTDGGLRAVNCACCGTCGCYSLSIPSALRSLFENANLSNLSAFGVSPAFFGYLQAEFSGGIANDIWYADFTYNLPEIYPIFYLGMGFYYQKSTGCLSMGSGGPPFDRIEGYTPGDYYDYDPGFVPEVTLFTDPPDTLKRCISLGYGGSSSGCHDPLYEPFPQDDTFTINGSGSFPFWYWRFNQDGDTCSEGSFPPPNIVIA